MLFGLAVALAVGVLVAYGIGTRTKSDSAEDTALGAVGAAMLALLGLLLAFSFAAAWQRFDRRLDLAIDEANAISTLDIRLSVLREGRAEARTQLLEYARARQIFNARLSSEPFGKQLTDVMHRATATALKGAVLDAAMEAQDAPERVMVIQALNETLDLGDKRRVEGRTHVPMPVMVVLALTALVSAFVAGQDLARGSRAARRVGWAFAVCVAATLFTVFDLEDPRVGLIRIDHADSLLREAISSLEDRQ